MAAAIEFDRRLGAGFLKSVYEKARNIAKTMLEPERVITPWRFSCIPGFLILIRASSSRVRFVNPVWIFNSARGTFSNFMASATVPCIIGKTSLNRR